MADNAKVTDQDVQIANHLKTVGMKDEVIQGLFKAGWKHSKIVAEMKAHGLSEADAEEQAKIVDGMKVVTKVVAPLPPPTPVVNTGALTTQVQQTKEEPPLEPKKDRLTKIAMIFLGFAVTCGFLVLVYLFHSELESVKNDVATHGRRISGLQGDFDKQKDAVDKRLKVVEDQKSTVDTRLDAMDRKIQAEVTSIENLADTTKDLKEQVAGMRDEVAGKVDHTTYDADKSELRRQIGKKADQADLDRVERKLDTHISDDDEIVMPPENVSEPVAPVADNGTINLAVPKGSEVRAIYSKQ